MRGSPAQGLVFRWLHSSTGFEGFPFGRCTQLLPYGALCPPPGGRGKTMPSLIDGWDWIGWSSDGVRYRLYRIAHRCTISLLSGMGQKSVPGYVVYLGLFQTVLDKLGPSVFRRQIGLGRLGPRSFWRQIGPGIYPLPIYKFNMIRTPISC